MVSYSTTLFLDKLPRGTFPVLSAHSFNSNYQLALLESVEEGNFSTKKCATRGLISSCCLRSGQATDLATLPSVNECVICAIPRKLTRSTVIISFLAGIHMNLK